LLGRGLLVGGLLGVGLLLDDRLLERLHRVVDARVELLRGVDLGGGLVRGRLALARRIGTAIAVLIETDDALSRAGVELIGDPVPIAIDGDDSE
jgi:hypothetical protein